MASDAELLEAWRDGDQRAGNRLLRRHFRSVFLFFRTKAELSSEDLTQRTFIACVEARDRVHDGPGGFKAYLFGIARHVLFRHFREAKLRHREQALGTMSVQDMAGTSPSAAFVRARDEHKLAEALRTIPLDSQIALELHYWEGMSATEIALVLDVPAGTVRSRIFRAREILRDALEASDSPALAEEVTRSGLAQWADSRPGESALDDSE